MKIRLSQKKKVFAEIGRLFLAEITNSNIFFGQKQVISKKKRKKGLRRNPKAFSGQNQVISKKKGLHRNPKAFSARNHKFKRFFWPKPATFPSPKNTVGGLEINREGGQKRKSGGALPPCPPLATHLPPKQKKRSSLELRGIFRPKSEIQTFFRPKTGDLKKKSLHHKNVMKSGVSPQKLRKYRWQTPIRVSICTPVAPSLLISSGHSPRLGGTIFVWGGTAQECPPPVAPDLEYNFKIKIGSNPLTKQ